MVEAVYIVISIVMLFCAYMYDETSKTRYMVAANMLAIPLMILFLKEELW